MQPLSLQIDGMTCGHCVAAVKQALADVPGVQVQNVVIGRATVSYDPATTTTTAITEAIADAGYAATVPL